MNRASLGQQLLSSSSGEQQQAQQKRTPFKMIALTKVKRSPSATSTTSAGLRGIADEALPEAVDFSEGGWATDFAASLVGFLFFASALLFYNDDNEHFRYMFLGTGLAHLFGGMAHRWFPNRAADGVGNRGFYIMMLFGYGGNILRYGYGWGLDPIFGYIAIGNAGYMLLTGLFVMFKMEHTTARIDHAKGTTYFPDRLFGIGEAFVSMMEVVTSVYFMLTQVGFADAASQSSILFYISVGANLIGWAAVYKRALLYMICSIDYDPSQMQRIFHFCMLLMLWSIDAAVRSAPVEE